MAKLLTILVVLLGLVGTVGFIRLPPGWVTPSFEGALKETIGPVQLILPEAQIRWGGWRHPLGINIRQVVIKTQNNNLSIEIPNLLLSLKIIPLLVGKAEIGRGTFESAKLYSKDNLLGVVSGKAKKRGKNVSLKAHFQKVDATALIHLFMGKQFPAGASFPIEGTIALEGSQHSGLSKINLNCGSKGGNLVVPEIYPLSLDLNNTQLILTGNDKTLTLKGASVKRGKATLDVKGSLHAHGTWKRLLEEGGKAELILEGKGGTILVDDLNLLWPQGLSPKPRKWVVNQLSKGTADQLNVQMKGLISMSPGGKITRFEVPTIGGEIDASGVRVDYFGKLPPVDDVRGKCRFTRQKFMIDAVGIAHGITLKSAKIVISDLHIKDQTIDIVMDLEGPVRNSLEIVNSQPLYLAKKLDLEPARISGQSTTYLHLAFPLETDLPLDLVNVTASSEIKEGVILYDAKLNGKPIKLDHGTFSLDVTKKSLEMKGNAFIQGVNTNIQWQEYFEEKNIPFRRQFLLEGNFDWGKLQNFGIDGRDYLAGDAKAKARYTVNQDASGIIEGFADLTSTTMVSPVLPWQKEKGQPAHVKLKVRKKSPEETFVLDTASLIAPNLAMVMEGGKSKQGNVVEVSHLQIGNSSLNSTIQVNRDGQIEATVRGKALDLSHILDDTTPEPLLKPQTSNDSMEELKIKVHLLLDKVLLGKENAIHQISGEMLYHGNTLMFAKLGGKAPHNNESILLSMNPLSENRQQFILQSGDGGHLLEMLGGGYDLEGGELIIKGVKTEKTQGSEKGAAKIGIKSWAIDGTINIDNFTINKAPLLARLLAAASLQGIVNIFSGRGIHFYEGQAEFSLTPEKLQLKKVRLISPSLGLTLNGSIDRIHHKVNFFGELIPLYFANALLANIPLLGSWMSGGREDGIFMTQFTLMGNRQDPTLMINPISSVTPGLVREFFTNQDAIPSTEVKPGSGEQELKH